MAEKKVSESGKSGVDSLKEALNKLTLFEAAKLVKELETEWGVSAAPAVAMAPAEGASTVNHQAAAEQTQQRFEVILKAINQDKRVDTMKLIRDFLEIKILDAQKLVNSLPQTLKSDLSKDEAKAIKDKFEHSDIQATVEVK